MLKLLANIILLVLLVQLLRPLVARFRSLFRRERRPVTDQKNERKYDELTPYEVEDAEFEDVKD